MIIQLTGLSGSGKSTISAAIRLKLLQAGLKVEIVDGDYYRMNLCKGLGFSKADRCENIRRLGMVASRFSEEGKIAIIAAINPYEEMRRELRQRYGGCLVYVQCELEKLIQRDTKGLYFRALLPKDHPNRLANLTGIGDPFEKPSFPDLILNTGKESVAQSVKKLESFILNRLQANSVSKDRTCHGIL